MWVAKAPKSWHPLENNIPHGAPIEFQTYLPNIPTTPFAPPPTLGVQHMHPFEMKPQCLYHLECVNYFHSLRNLGDIQNLPHLHQQLQQPHVPPTLAWPPTQLPMVSWCCKAKCSNSKICINNWKHLARTNANILPINFGHMLNAVDPDAPSRKPTNNPQCASSPRKFTNNLI